MTRRLVILATLLVPWSSPVLAQSPRPVSAAECIDLALQSNRDLRMADERVIEAEALRREVRSSLLPGISAQASMNRLSPNVPDFVVDFPEGVIPGIPGGDFVIAPAIRQRYESTLRVQQPLFQGGTQLRRLQEASLGAEASRHLKEYTQQEVAYRVSEAYWRLYQAVQEQQVIATARRQVETHVRDVRELRAQGMALESDVLAVQTRAAEVELMSVEADNRVQLSRLVLDDLVGLPLGTVLVPADEPISPMIVEASERALSASDGRPDVLAQETLARSTEAAALAERGAWLPQISAFWEGLYARPNNYIQPQEDTFKGTWAVGLTVSMDLWDWGRTSARTQQARARAHREAIQAENVRRQAQVEAERSRLELVRAGSFLEVSARGLEEARTSYEVLQRRHAEGTAPTSELLDAELAFRQAELRHARAGADLEIARAGLLRATGRMPANVNSP